MLDDAESFAPGDRVRDRYRVVRLVGKGGMGEVYEVHDETTGDRLALKTVLPRLAGNPKIVARFQRESVCSQKIAHPNVLQIYDVFEHAPPGAGPEARPVPCMLMELLEGETVADRLGRGETFSPEEARPVVCQTAAALAAAHRRHVVHRDLKPDNVFLVPSPDAEGGVRVVLTDFGVARFERRAHEHLTESNVVLGTPTYMAPEQLELEDAIPASDVYTLGLVAYEMLTGRPPFEADTPLQMVFKRVQEDPIPPQRHVPDLDPRWIEVIERCLARRPEERLGPDEVIAVLEGKEAVRRYRRGDAAAAPPPPAAARRPRTRLLLAAAVVVAVVVTVLWLAL